jgi:hypothetical protein
MSIVEQAHLEPFSSAGMTLIDVMVATPPYFIFLNYE